MYSEDDLIPISAIQHIMFCERQFALIHLEQLWQENMYTAEGKVLHERVDTAGHESRKLFRQEFAMSIRSLEYGLIGKTDLVELYLEPTGGVAEAIPVEFKRGKDKENDCDKAQLYAQALCLQEMFNIHVTTGSLYYLGSHRRTPIEFSSELQSKTLHSITRARRILESGMTPQAVYEKNKCDRCSLIDLCMPTSVGVDGKRVTGFIESELAFMRKEFPQ